MITDLERCTEGLSSDETMLLFLRTFFKKKMAELPQEDREDFRELWNGMFSTEDPEELESISAAMREILENKPATVQLMAIAAEPHEKLGKWIDRVASKIRDCRVNAGLTQEKLAELSGLPQSHISRLEAGKHSPSHMTLKKIANALGIPMSKLGCNAPDQPSE